MEMEEWQQKFVDAVAQKFPLNKDNWTSRDRVLSLMSQVTDVGIAIQSDEGIRLDRKNEDSTRHLIASVFIDLFLLCEEYEVDLEEEWKEALDWLYS